jgi:hypothetical protein
VRRSQFGTGIDTQLVGQLLADPLIDGEGFGLLTGHGQGQHQPGLQRLVERGTHRRLLQHRQQAMHLPGTHPGVGRLTRRGQKITLHRREDRMRAGVGIDPSRAHATPQLQRLGEQRGSTPRIGLDRLAGLLAQHTEPQDVNGINVGVKPVPTRRTHQPPARRTHRQIRLQQPPQHTDMAVHHIHRSTRRVRTPQHIHNLTQTDRLPGPHQEQRQQRPLLRPTQIDLLGATPRTHRPQHREPHLTTRQQPHHPARLPGR